MITVFGKNGGGGHHVGVTVGDVSATLQSNGAGHDAAVLAAARAIESTLETCAAKDAQIAELEAALAASRSLLRVARAQRDAALASIDAATCGRRRFNGPVLCAPHLIGDWSGVVWLLDPAKGFGGFGIQYPSLADLRRAHPELWICGTKADGILLDASPLAPSLVEVAS